MSKKKKKTSCSESVISSDCANKYFQLWLQLNAARDEKDFDDIRKSMSNIWITMSEFDKNCFKTLSDTHERKRIYK